MKRVNRLISILFALSLIISLTGCSAKLDEVSGSIVSTVGARDDEFNVETDSALLVRDVELVQWYKDEKGTRLVLANFPIESFEDNGVKYDNPKFPSDVTYKEFYGEASIGDVKLGESVLTALFRNGAEMKKITELDEYGGFKYELTIYQNDSYTSPKNDWNLGDVKVVFYELKDSSKYTIKGQLNEGVLEIVEGSSIKK